MDCVVAGLATNSISILLTFYHQGLVHTSTFSKNGQSGGPLHLARHAYGDFVSLWLAMHEASQGPLMGALSAQNALQGSELVSRELSGRTYRE